MVEFSVIIPCYNYGQFLRDSLSSALSQKNVTLEIIVVNDGSTDDSFEAVQQLQSPYIRLINTPHRGIGAARNRGVAEATGSFLAFLDADDAWREDRLIRARKRIYENSTPSLSFTMVQEFLDPSMDAGQKRLPEVRRMVGISASACVVKRAVFDTIGQFDESLESGEFIDWYIRAQRLGVETDVDPDVLVFRRIHQYNRDRRSRESSKEYARILMRKIKTSKENE